MKIVTSKKIKHCVYETDNEFKSAYPEIDIKETLDQVSEGDWIRSEQGFIVQCIRKRTYIDMSKGTGARKTPRVNTYYAFPRMSKIVRAKDANSTLYYFPTSDKFVSDAVEDYPMAQRPKVRLFIEYIRNGLSPHQAYFQAFGERSNRRTAFLLSRKDILEAIMKNNGAFMKEELERAGLNKEDFAKEIVKIVKDSKENAVVRKWALETVNGILNNVPVTEAHDSFDPVLQASIQNN